MPGHQRVPVFSRVIVIVLDGAGCGELPDADAYGDAGSDTLGNVARRVPLRVPNLRALGLGHLVRLDGELPAEGLGARGRMAEASAGKDSVTGHWELTGLILDAPFPTFPHGFPQGFIRELEQRIRRRTLGNVAASGTDIIERLGPAHVQTGEPIVYTSADSVLQIAAHESVIPVAEQYRICEAAFDLVSERLGVPRVIARPFIGAPGAFVRTANRHDFALAPPLETLLDVLGRHRIPVTAIGKVGDLFAGRGIDRSFATSSDAEGMARLTAALDEGHGGLIFANLVDFDTLYGHRNDVAGYARNLEQFDERLGPVMAALRDADLLVVTADHGNDPTTPGTDHSREYVPVLMAGARVNRDVSIGTRATFADLGQTIAAGFGVSPLGHGTSFLEEIVGGHP